MMRLTFSILILTERRVLTGSCSRIIYFDHNRIVTCVTAQYFHNPSARYSLSDHLTTSVWHLHDRRPSCNLSSLLPMVVAQSCHVIPSFCCLQYPPISCSCCLQVSASGESGLSAISFLSVLFSASTFPECSASCESRALRRKREGR